MSALANLTHPADGPVGVPPNGATDGGGNLDITILPGEQTLILRLAGHLDLATVGTFRTCLEHVDPGWQTLVVDLADLTFIDSTGISEFVRCWRSCEQTGRHLIVTSPSDRIRFVFDLTGLGHLVA